MAVTYGFYNSVGGDRRYDARQISKLFDGLIQNGVFASIGRAFMVSPVINMTIAVAEGRAWFNGTWTYNDADLPFTLDPADTVFPRTDAVVLEVDTADEVRVNTIKVITGSPGSQAPRPTLENTATKHQYPFAYILVPKDAPSIIVDNITNMVGTAECPFVTGPASGITTTNLLAQWEAQFTTWFENAKGQLSTDPAGHLQNEIDGIIGEPVFPPAIDLKTLKTHDHTGGNGNPIGASGIADGAVGLSKIAAGVLSWLNIGGKPASYPPSGHMHDGGDIATAVANALSVPWGGVMGKPTTRGWDPQFTGISGNIGYTGGGYIKLESYWVLFQHKLVGGFPGGCSGNGNSYMVYPSYEGVTYYPWQNIGFCVFYKPDTQDYIGMGGFAENGIHFPKINWSLAQNQSGILIGVYYGM